MLREKQVEAERVIEALLNALKEDGDTLLDADERAKIENSMQHLQQTAQGSDQRAIKHAIEEADKATQEYAERRMNASINKALTGHTLDEFSDSE